MTDKPMTFEKATSYITDLFLEHNVYASLYDIEDGEENNDIAARRLDDLAKDIAQMLVHQYKAGAAVAFEECTKLCEEYIARIILVGENQYQDGKNYAANHLLEKIRERAKR